MKQSFSSLFTAILLTAILSIVVYTTFFKKTPQQPQKPYDLTYLQPYLNKIDSLGKLKDNTTVIYRTIYDTILQQPFTATVAMLDTMFADTVRYTDSTLLLTHSQGKQVGVWYAEQNECREVLAYTEQGSAVKDTIIDEQLEVLVEQGGTIDSLNAVVAAEKPKKWKWLGSGAAIGFMLGIIIR